MSGFGTWVDLALTAVGQLLGAIPIIGKDMPGPYNAAQIADAKQDYDFWTAKKAPEWVVGSLLGNNCREDSFLDALRGDKDTAGGKSQWHLARDQIILKNTGIDVWKDPPEKQLEAMYAEMTAPWSSYRHVWSQLLATTNYHDANIVLIKYYEQSGSQATDLVKQDAFAAYWIDYARANWAPQAAA